MFVRARVNSVSFHSEIVTETETVIPVTDLVIAMIPGRRRRNMTDQIRTRRIETATRTRGKKTSASCTHTAMAMRVPLAYMTAPLMMNMETIGMLPWF